MDNDVPAGTPTFVGSPDLFTLEECKDIITYGSSAGWREGDLLRGAMDKDVRSVEMNAFDRNSENEYIFNRIFGASIDINNRFFNFGLFGVEPFLICKYSGGDRRDHYVWHSDSLLAAPGEPWQRKLSLSVLLNDPSEFEGGRLEVSVDQGDQPTWSHEYFKKAGDAVWFPSFMRHRVTPVTRGTRYTLVTWIAGPRWI